MPTIDSLREAICGIDDTIIEALQKRQDLVRKVAGDKSASGDEVRHRSREREVLTRVDKAARERGIDPLFAKGIFQDIMEHSRALQRELLSTYPRSDDSDASIRVAIPGAPGSYSSLAAQRHFVDGNATFSHVPTFAAAIAAVEEGKADVGVIPIENTTAGSINETYDLLQKTSLHIVGEEIQRIAHCLIGLEDVPVAHVRRIYSHPQALTQCSRFLADLQNCRLESHLDTASAVEKIKLDADLSQAAIGSEEAASLYGLTVLKRNIANQKDNYTRFVLVAPGELNFEGQIARKTSLLLATAHREGALARCLNALAKHGLNMTKLESRPRPDMPWEYLFYIDFEGDTGQEETQKALEAVQREATFIKVLGCYPSADKERLQPSLQQLISLRKGAGCAPPAPPPQTSKNYHLVTRAHKETDTIVEVKGARFGGDGFVVIAGPCAVESASQIESCARAVQECGAQMLRGGCFKPRTSPYSFQGMGFEGLNLMAEAGKGMGLPIITEVLTPEDAPSVADQADVLQVGARNMQNFALLTALGKIPRPVLLKRGLMASIDELLAAAEYILSQGNKQVILCERGIRTFETATRNTLDLSAVPILRSRTHLPIIVDPSHAAGRRELVLPLSKAAKAVGAHGIMVEIHPSPPDALSDGEQSLDFEQFSELMAELMSTK